MTHAIRKRGEVCTPPNTTPAPCYPDKSAVKCLSCARFRGRHPREPEARTSVVIDCSALRDMRNCPMYVPFVRRQSAPKRVWSA